MLRPVDRCITTYILEGRIVSIFSVKQPENFRLLASLDGLCSMELVNAMYRRLPTVHQRGLGWF